LKEKNEKTQTECFHAKFFNLVVALRIRHTIILKLESSIGQVNRSTAKWSVKYLYYIYCGKL